MKITIKMEDLTWQEALGFYASMGVFRDENGLQYPIEWAKFTVLCPFHDEKTGSLHIDFNDLNYRCYGCGAKGTIYKLRSDVADFKDSQGHSKEQK